MNFAMVFLFFISLGNGSPTQPIYCILYVWMRVYIGVIANVWEVQRSTHYYAHTLTHTRIYNFVLSLMFTSLLCNKIKREEKKRTANLARWIATINFTFISMTSKPIVTIIDRAIKHFLMRKTINWTFAFWENNAFHFIAVCICSNCE